MAYKESVPALDRRVGEFLCWLTRRPERCVEVVGHSLFHRAFMGKDGRIMGHCEVHCLYK